MKKLASMFLFALFLAGFVFEGGARAASLNLSLCFVVDASGSMRGNKITAAKDAVRTTVGTLRSDLGIETSLFAFGGCNSCRLMQDFTQNPQSIVNSLGFSAGGDTPLAFSMKKGADYLETTGQGSRGVLIVLSDGKETCGGDPAAVAREIAGRQMSIRIEVIGFDIRAGSKVENQLKEIAGNGNGKYYPAHNVGDLANVFKKVVDSSIKSSLPSAKQGEPLRFEQLGPSDWNDPGRGPDKKKDPYAPDYEQYDLN
ncbi:MAG: vWA domain-containing protein [Thermodesulfobacteriota bacterium]